MYHSISIGLNLISIVLTFAVLIFPITSAIWLIVKRENTVMTWFVWFCISSVSCYVLLIGSVLMTNSHLGMVLDSYDLDGDGCFSRDEQTPEMQSAMKDVVNDTGRSLAPFTGLISMPLYAGGWYLLLGVPYMLIRWSNKEDE